MTTQTYQKNPSYWDWRLSNGNGPILAAEHEIGYNEGVEAAAQIAEAFRCVQCGADAARDIRDLKIKPIT